MASSSSGWGSHEMRLDRAIIVLFAGGLLNGVGAKADVITYHFTGTLADNGGTVEGTTRAPWRGASYVLGKRMPVD